MNNNCKETLEKENQRPPEMTLEESFEQLDEIVNKLENENLSLEASFKIYQTGMELLKSCNSKIDNVEKKMMQINDNGELSEF